MLASPARRGLISSFALKYLSGSICKHGEDIVTGKPLIVGMAALLVASSVFGQQMADLEYRPVVSAPAYASELSPIVAIDEAHHNFHTAEGRYKPFAELLRRDGYQVRSLTNSATASSLGAFQVLVIANPLHERNVTEWKLPTPCAFTADEISAIEQWVERGGSLFLILDHMPFPGAGGDVAQAFGIQFSNGFAVSKTTGQPSTFIFRPGSGGLAESAVTRGRTDQERITQVATFVGSAFTVPTNATPVLVFNEEFECLVPTEAWQFTAATRKVALNGWCQGALMKVGRGRLAVFGEAGMFTAQVQVSGSQRNKMGMNAPEAVQNQQFLLNIIHWLSRLKGMPD